ncbi:DUF4169 family protein [Hyphomonas sp. FCG-A18]|uniref:DUF4169 family protein n=1 Tax=Hyphomonas sp. FCG-A18 TaxID=3080019 RepID=UPI002B2FA5EE|nr:DUF4169 family protein [Hyphomonas sp. FCG-A18]
MTEPINLNKARKAKARVEKQKRAAENRIKYGRTKAQKAADKLSQEKTVRHLDLSKRDKD